MKKADKSARDGTQLIWERSEPGRRPAPSPLSRSEIVQAAIAIADREGLDAVSLRRVAALVNSGPMRLYGYLSTKEELLDLMADEVHGKMMSAGLADGDWRAVLRSIALRTRQAVTAHKWFIDLLGGRPHLGPHALKFLETALAALRGKPGFADIDVSLQTLRTLNAYVIGALHGEASELRAERDSALTKSAWQTATWPYLQRLIATGEFPNLAAVIRDANHPSAAVAFDQGLDCFLDGIAARLGL